MSDLLDNIRRAANGCPYGMDLTNSQIESRRADMDYDFSHNIKNLKCLQLILEKSGYQYSTVKTVQDTIKYLEEKEKESK